MELVTAVTPTPDGNGTAIGPPMVARKKLPALLRKAGYPTTLGTINQLTSRGDGPPIAHRWGNKTYYSPAKVLEWAHERARIDKD